MFQTEAEAIERMILEDVVEAMETNREDKKRR